jgi:hypothetical protein
VQRGREEGSLVAGQVVDIKAAELEEENTLVELRHNVQEQLRLQTGEHLEEQLAHTEELKQRVLTHIVELESREQKLFQYVVDEV